MQRSAVVIKNIFKLDKERSLKGAELQRENAHTMPRCTLSEAI